MKFCKICHKEKSLSEFHNNKRRKDGLQLVCKECKNSQMRKYWHETRDARLKTSRAYYRTIFKRLRTTIFDKYGGKCACCGENRWPFLSIDHINGGGRKHRKEIGQKSGVWFYRWLEQNGFPDGYQVLCHNCNQAKGFHGFCPHKTPEATWISRRSELAQE